MTNISVTKASVFMCNKICIDELFFKCSAFYCFEVYVLTARCLKYCWLFQICHNTMSDAPQTKLELLTTICEDLHVHMNHWNSLKQLLHTDVWLQSFLPYLSSQIDIVRRTLFQLRDSALWWIDRLIRVGLQVGCVKYYCHPYTVHMFMHIGAALLVRSVCVYMLSVITLGAGACRLRTH